MASEEKKKNKFSFSAVAEDMKAFMSGSEALIGSAVNLGTISENPKDYVVMPEWWKASYGILGLQFGRVVQIAGDTNSGKTTLSMQAIKCAQDQGYGVIYIETEGKTPVEKFLKWGIDPEAVWTASSKFTEVAFDAGFEMLNRFFTKFPKEKLLFVFDSYGNTVSSKEKETSLLKEARVGGTAKVNRRAMNMLLAHMQNKPVAALIVNYCYDNIGSVGKTNAGGKALDFFCSLIIQSKRVGWVEKTVKGVAGVAGAKVKWNATKNQWADCLTDVHVPKAIELSITDEGFKLL